MMPASMKPREPVPVLCATLAPRGDLRIGRALPDQLEQHALVVRRGRRHLVEAVLTPELRRNAEAVRGALHAERVAPALDLAEADQIDDGAGARVVADDDH